MRYHIITCLIFFLEIAGCNEERWASVMQMGCLFNVNVNVQQVRVGDSCEGTTTSETAESHGLLFFANELSASKLFSKIKRQANWSFVLYFQ